ncbi:outer membrane lipoprotein-sorting protein [Govanella unica]|uniref:Outer membrane lipoprotein-sorting protein n=1 Tax=Govanella unica TaxID=2975056 RepID=A0A9X3TZE4_9PROT|nr:outer membrane lipoprotein-sorting protein [Govania unica]MDA5194606.1 outer membrane lipoprotein-sorting protein [Govania unica]
MLCRPLLNNVIALLLLTTVAHAETPVEKGLAIATEADQRNRGFKDSEAQLTMTLKNAQGQESRRVLRIRILENPSAGDKSLVVFDAPKDISGTALLSYANGIEPDDQWLFLPDVGRVKRISGANRSGPFMSSEFAYEDMSAPKIEKYTYQYLRDEACGPLTCQVIERKPVYADSGYSREVIWLDREHLRPWKVDFYDRRNELFKTLTYSGYKAYGKYWRAHQMVMTNVRTGKSTDLEFSGYRFGIGFNDGDFSQNALKRVR